MINRPFFSCSRPKLKYPVIQSHKKEAVKEIPSAEKVTLLLERAYSPIDDEILKVGDEVRTGQKIKMTDGGEEYFISTVTGTVEGISEYIGYLGRSHTSISIKVSEEDQWDDEFKEISKTVSPENVMGFLCRLPGDSHLSSLINPVTFLNTIVINGVDKDLLITTNQLIVKTETQTLKEGMAYLKKITGVSQILLVVPPDLVYDAEKTGIEIKVINPVYPNALPRIVMKNILKRTVPAGKKCEEMGVGFINAEAVAALARAFNQGKIPVNKFLTVINKDGESVNVKARIGTPVRDILNFLHIEVNHGDRLVLGGPMRGNSIYSEDLPVLWDTDSIMVQDKDQIIFNSDTPCINCGECVRACPAGIPVNMLVRVLENSLYDEAVNEYDLLSCLECGLCAYVCTARIPLFHHIMLGKYEFERIKSMEESHA
ncbi:MAG: 4Fe-4S dicluster domain-containing protein [Deltaproteobacteria bacterium]|nr:4Fe-4S dicluster domain-containing protein [Deltaproteobacteria bacterium]